MHAISLSGMAFYLGKKQKAQNSIDISQQGNIKFLSIHRKRERERETKPSNFILICLLIPLLSFEHGLKTGSFLQGHHQIWRLSSSERIPCTHYLCLLNPPSLPNRSIQEFPTCSPVLFVHYQSVVSLATTYFSIYFLPCSLTALPTGKP